jgi:hypothetical protein
MPVQKILAVGSNGANKQIEPIVATAGAADAGKPVALDTDGKLNASLMPNGIGASTKIVTASEALSAGNLVNIFFDTDTWYARKADASDAAKYAVGFVEEAFESDASVEVYLSGEIDVTADLDEVYLTQTPGIAGVYDPTAVIRQLVGRRVGANVFTFIQGEITIL